MTDLFPRQVTDEHGTTYTLRKTPLAQGGQGVVFLCSTPNMLVKLVAHKGQPIALDPERPTPSHIALRTALSRVRTLPLDGISVIRPEAILRDFVGYTMVFLDEMVPLQNLLVRTPEDYIQTGGLRRRLRLLAKLAQVLGQLHARGIVFVDLSPNNVFVSESAEFEAVHLIDPDNLAFTGPNVRRVWTPRYAAPEINRGERGADMTTDAFSFAILAFELLTLAHPFLGELTDEGGWSVSQLDGEDRGFRGDFPWILDEEDDRNFADPPVPAETVISKRLRSLFARVFGPGRSDPNARPRMLEWAEALSRAADATVRCSQCKSTSFLRRNVPCAWCEDGEWVPTLHVHTRLWSPELDPQQPESATQLKQTDGEAVGAPVQSNVFMDAVGDIIIRQHILWPTLFRSGDPPSLEVRFEQDGLLLTPQDDRLYHLVVPSSGKTIRLDDATPKLLPLPRRNEWYLRCGPLDQVHRIAFFRFYSSFPRASR